MITEDHEYWIGEITTRHLVAHGTGKGDDIRVRQAGEPVHHAILTISHPETVPVMSWGRAWEACPETRREVEETVLAGYRKYWADHAKMGRR